MGLARQAGRASQGREYVTSTTSRRTGNRSRLTRALDPAGLNEPSRDVYPAPWLRLCGSGRMGMSGCYPRNKSCSVIERFFAARRRNFLFEASSKYSGAEGTKSIAAGEHAKRALCFPALCSRLPLCPNVHLIARYTAHFVKSVCLALALSRIVRVPHLGHHPTGRVEGCRNKLSRILDQAIANRPESNNQCGPWPAVCANIRPNLSKVGYELLPTGV